MKDNPVVYVVSWQSAFDCEHEIDEVFYQEVDARQYIKDEQQRNKGFKEYHGHYEITRIQTR